MLAALGVEIGGLMVVVWVGWEVRSFCFSWSVDVTAVFDIHSLGEGNCRANQNCSEGGGIQTE